MAAFNYRALDSEGREVRGVLEAETSRIARGHLRDQNLAPVEVTVAGRRSVDRPYGSRSGIRTGSLSLVTRQWSTLLAAGLTIERSLSALIEQTEDQGVQEVLGGVRAEVLAGHSLHAALGRFEDVFPPIYRALVNAGEKSGELPTLLARLADYLEASQATRQKILQALLYPAIVVVVALAVITGLVTYVVPQIVGVFVQSKQTLPLLTRALILVSDLMRTSGVWLAVAAVALAILVQRALRNEALRLRWHARLLKTPLLGRFLRTVDSARFASTMAILVGSGVPLLAALEAGKGVIGNLVLRRSVERAIGFVREGTPLHRALATERVFPPLLIHLIASGEASGTLDEMLARAAQQQQIELDHRTALALGLFEPLLILLMGGLVLLIVLAVLLPIININLLLR
ncbi:MAG: type II secretion system protein GspF [Betaproteobacteria bacterium RIFCSPLOWO2_12_FULL_63_13]|nr:MAG: type II secretion system protein GspF [Betaproteobacteria bacterium RIFCSPLOWO2_12_FULL_63_13]